MKASEVYAPTFALHNDASHHGVSR